MLVLILFSCRVLKHFPEYVNEFDTQTIIQLSDSEACGEMGGIKCHTQVGSCAVSVSFVKD